MSNIPINPKKGLDPRLTYCGRCGCETNEIIIGDNRLMENTDGQKALAPRGQTTQIARKLGWDHYTVNEVPEGKLPATEPCDSCKAELIEWDEIAKAGGVYFRCDECKQSGMIKPSDYATVLRKHTGTEPNDPCGVTFETCRMHTTEDQDDSDDKKG